MPTRPKPIAKTKLVNGERVPIGTSVTDVQDITTTSSSPSGIDYTWNVGTETADQYNTRIEKARGSSPTMEESGFTTPTLQTDSAADLFAKQYQKDAMQTIDQGKIRQNYISQFQDQINALNQIYDQQLSKAQKEGVGRVGSGTAILARRGLGGSPRGEAIKEGVLDQNRGIENAIQQERAVAIQAIYGKATELAQKEAAERRAAKESGATKYLEYLKGQDSRKSSNLASVVQALLAQGIDPETMSADELNAVGKQIGVDGKSLLGSYKVAKYTFDKEKAAADAQAIKDNTTTLSEGQSIVVYNPKTGKYETVASMAKTYAPSSGGSGGSGGTGAYGGAPISDAAKNIINQLNVAGGSIDDYVKGTNIAAQNLRNEVLRGLNAQGGLTDRSTELFNEAKSVVDTLLNEGGYKALGGYSTRFGGQFTTAYGDAKARAQQLEAILARDNLGLLKGAMSDKDLAFIQSMSSGFQGEGIQSEAFIKQRLTEIQDKLTKRLSGGVQAQGGAPLVDSQTGEEIIIVD